MRAFLYIFIMSFFVQSSVFAQTTISELKKPNTNTVDFTFNSVTVTSPSFSSGTIVDKVAYELKSLQKLFPRAFKVSGCLKDSYNTLYCPDALARADEYWGYDQSEVIARKQTVIDFEQGTYQEFTSTVRDFMDGFATRNTNSVIDYQNGTSTGNTSTVVDRTNGTVTSHTGTVIDKANGSIKINTGSVVDYQSNSTATSHVGSVVDYTNKVSNTTYTSANVTYAGGWTVTSGTGFFSCAGYRTAGFVIPDSCETGSTNGSSSLWWKYFNGTNGCSTRYYTSRSTYQSYTYGIGETTGMYTSSDGDDNGWGATNYVTVQCVPISTTYSCSNGASPVNGQCPITTTTCPSGYIDNGSNCFKTVSYNYYSYSCPTGYTPINSGFSSYTKTDPNTSAENWNSLDDAVNSSTAPASNCKKTITFNYYQYQCPTGFTAANSGLSSCTKTDPNITVNNESTLDDPCNSATPPANNCGKTVTYQYYTYLCPSGYTATSTGVSSCTKTDPSSTTDNTSTLDDACNSSTSPTGNCTKEVSYNYYAYNCPVGYTATSAGMSNCTKTDPSNTTNNTSTLDDACNSSTSPTGNCTKEVYYDHYSYECSSGYTAIDTGLSSCSRTDSSTSTGNSSTLDDACNSATPPRENCYKDISYKHYTYGCSPGYITDNYGLSTCPKTDPDKNVNNSSTLDDDCNSKTPPAGNCQKPIEYSYYEYICTGTNAFGETYNPINAGLATCTKTDSNKIAVNGSTLDDACNSSTAPVNNCRATEYTCNSSLMKPAFVDNKWQCSPYVCNSEQECGTATCNDYPPSTEFFMEQGLLPMKPDYNGSCVSVLCDITMNQNISYCDAGEACPKTAGVYTKNGKCYYDECPQGSYIDSEGRCVVE